MVYQVSKSINIPILGLGGIVTPQDAIEYILAGARAISVGTGNFIAPDTAIKVVDGIEDYMKKYNIKDINEIVGTVQMN